MIKNIIIIFLVILIACFCAIGIFFMNGAFLVSSLSQEFEVSFDQELDVTDGAAFGPGGHFTFELYRGGSFVIDTKKGEASQISNHYGDVALIRSTDTLPAEYIIRVKIGEIDYGLDHLLGLSNDPLYREGPLNENGCYLIAITDQPPTEHYTNDWWHQHRKLVIDVDNNVWGHGAPNPIFMAYFDRNNQLLTFDGDRLEWVSQWTAGVRYEENQWYTVELQKTKEEYFYRIFDHEENLLRESRVFVDEVWHADEKYSEYFVIGDPHENYYQGSFKIKNISMSL